MPGKTEQVEPVVEQETKGESKADLLDKTFAELATASPEEAKASTERETESEEEEEKEESFEDKVTRLAQSMKDKELKPVYKELNDLKTQHKELQAQLNDKVWDRHLQGLFNEDVENLGEDEAKVRQIDRQKVAEQVKEFRLKKEQVDKAQVELDEKMPKLGAIERDQKAKVDLWPLIFPEDKAKITQLDTLLKKFEKAKDWDDYDLILEGIRESVKGKNKFVPDSSQGGGGGGVDLSKLTPRELMERGYRKKK